jgi:hypothetical protein
VSGIPAARSWYQSARFWAIAAVLTLLAIVGLSAAVLSFSAIRDLAIACGFDHGLAWLLPITIDAGAAAGTVVWLSRTLAPDDARTFAARLALSLLTLSVLANSTGHYLAVEHAAPFGMPFWLLVAIVSAIAPATLGAVVHLAVLARRAPDGAHADEPARAHVRSVPAHTVALDKDEDEALTADASKGDGYSAALRREAAELGVPLAPAPPGEDRKDRRARLHRVRSRVDRARKARDNPGDNPGDPSGALAMVGGSARGD